jgi:hypothetical protein
VPTRFRQRGPEGVSRLITSPADVSFRRRNLLESVRPRRLWSSGLAIALFRPGYLAEPFRMTHLRWPERIFENAPPHVLAGYSSADGDFGKRKRVDLKQREHAPSHVGRRANRLQDMGAQDHRRRQSPRPSRHRQTRAPTIGHVAQANRLRSTAIRTIR